MPIPAHSFRWFYPPRTDIRIPFKDGPVLDMWRSFPDAYAQFKMDGSNDMLVVHPDSRVENWSRHKIDPKSGKDSPLGDPRQLNWTMPAPLRDEVLSFTPKGKLTVYNIECLHAKTPTVKNTLYFFDVLIWDGMYLTGMPYGERYAIIEKAVGKRYMPLDRAAIDGQIYLAQNFAPKEWDGAWNAAQGSVYCEGLVLKRHGAASILQQGDREKNNGGFLCRIRKPKKNFRY